MTGSEEPQGHQNGSELLMCGISASKKKQIKPQHESGKSFPEIRETYQKDLQDIRAALLGTHRYSCVHSSSR